MSEKLLVPDIGDFEEVEIIEILVKEGDKIARSIARRAIAARKAGKSLNLTNVGRKIMGKTTGGVIGGGIGEAIVAEEDIGTLADIAKGTSLECRFI